LESIPEEARAVGRKVMGRAPDGSEDMFDVVAIRGDTAVVDMNHPLAGRELRFELKVLRKNPLQS
jgi:FKBP-type peptidyl-prolyl cis-trans isomerase 2